MSRGATDGQTTSPEEQALADVILRHKPLPLAIAVNTATGAGASLASPVSLAASACTAGPTAAGTAAATSLDSRSSAPVPPPHTSIRIHVLVGKIDDVARNAVQGEPPIDCIAVGHYLRVLPTGAENSIWIGRFPKRCRLPRRRRPRVLQPRPPILTKIY